MRTTEDLERIIQQFEAITLEQKELLARQDSLLSELRLISETTGAAQDPDTISVPPSLPELIPREASLGREGPGTESRSIIAQALEAGEIANAVIGGTGPLAIRVELDREGDSSSHSSVNSQEVVVRFPTSVRRPANTIQEYLPPDHILVPCPSPRNISIGDRVYITNQISHGSGNELRDRFGTVKKVNLIRNRVVFVTDSGTTTNRKTKNVKLVVSQNV